MSFPTVAVNTTNVDGTTDKPSDARADLLDLIQKFNALIATYAQSNGICDLDGSGLIPLARIPANYYELTQLITTQTLSSPANNIQVTGLNLNAAGGFELLIHTQPTTTASGVDLQLYFNNDTAANHYAYGYKDGVGYTYNDTNATKLLLSQRSGSGFPAFHRVIIKPFNNTVSVLWNGMAGRYAIDGGGYWNQSANVTQINLSAGENFITGSKVIVRKL